MDINTQFKSALLEFDVIQSLLGRYCGFESSRTSRAMSEEKLFDQAETYEIIQIIQAMRSLQAEIRLPINWAMIGKVKPSVEQRRIELRDQADPMLSKYCVVRTSKVSFFVRINGDNILSSPSELTCAMFEAPGLANQVVQELAKHGVKGEVHIVPLLRRKSLMTKNLFELGFTEIGGPDGTDNGTN